MNAQTASALRNGRLFLLLFAFCSPAYAFQVADGARPGLTLADKFIFYWGKHQCDLLESNGYHGVLEISDADFRQLMLHPPKVWNGREIMNTFEFNLEGSPVSTRNYAAGLADLNTRLAPSIKPGKTIRLSKLQLAEGIRGTIDIQLSDSDDGSSVIYGNAPFQRSSQSNTMLTEQVIWGREDILEISNRDFFTVSELWQTISQEPAVSWRPGQAPVPLRVEVGFNSADKVTMNVTGQLDELPYASFVESLEPYRYLVRPGATVTLQLQTANQYDVIYKKILYIVSDRDPRLRKRIRRDQHKLSLVWSAWSESMDNLYLDSYTDENGNEIPVDPPIARYATLRISGDEPLEWGKQKPEAWIDGEPVSGDISFRVRVADSLYYYIHSENLDTAHASAFFRDNNRDQRNVTVDSIAIEGYTLPAMTFSLFQIKLRDGILLRNEFSLLKQFSNSPSAAKMIQPRADSTAFHFSFELPGKTPFVLSIYRPEGLNVFFQDGNLESGKQTIPVSRDILRDKGKYLAFLNTSFGVNRIEFEVD